MEFNIREIKECKYEILNDFLYDATEAFRSEGEGLSKDFTCSTESQLCSKNVSSGTDVI